MAARATLAGLLVLLLAGAGCGDEEDAATPAGRARASAPAAEAPVPPAAPTVPTTDAWAPIGAAALAGRTFLLDEAVVQGERRALVGGVPIEMTFTTGGSIGVHPGCNGIGSGYDLDGDRLVIGGERGEITSTAMGCAESLMEQDEWFARVLAAHPSVALSDDRIELRTADTVVHGRDQRAVPPRVPLPGTTWAVWAVMEGGTGWGWMPGARLALAADGSLRMDSRCGVLTGAYAVDGTAFATRGVDVEDDTCAVGDTRAASMADAARILADVRYAVGIGERVRLLTAAGAWLELGPPG